MPNFNFKDFNIDYPIIEIMNKYLSDTQFIRLYKDYDINHFIFDAGFIHEKFLHKISIGYLDLSLEDNDSIGRQKLRSLGCNYEIYASMKLRDAPKGLEYLKDKYEIILIDINKSNYDKFIIAMNSVINIAFNNRDIGYFELLRSVLRFGYSFIITTSKIPMGIKRNPMKFNNYSNYIDIEVVHCNILTTILNEINEKIELEIKKDEIL